LTFPGVFKRLKSSHAFEEADLRHRGEWIELLKGSNYRGGITGNIVPLIIQLVSGALGGNAAGGVALAQSP
jgi:hypothetical protein